MIEFEANNAHYNVISILGGCYNGIGVVYLAKHTLSGQMVAVKRYNMDKVKDEIGLIQVKQQILHFKSIMFEILLIYSMKLS